MIARYTRPELGAIWTDEARMSAWRDVEVAACEAMEGPTAQELDAIRAATFSVEAVNERERTTDHDVAAFVDVLSESAGSAGRWIHYGLTSSDVLDTALALQLRRAGEAIVPGAQALVAALAARAREHRTTLCVGRTHGVHAEPTSFGIKLAGFAFEAHRNAQRLERAFAQAAVGAISGAVGTYAADLARVRGARARAARARGASRSPPRSSRATATPSCCRRSRSPAPAWSASRPRSATSSAPRCARSRSRSAPARRARARCRTSATRSRASRSPGWRACCAATLRPRVENVALWHERDISHSSVERVILPDSTILIDYLQARATALVEGMVVHADRMRENLELTCGALFSQRVLLALVEQGDGARRGLPCGPADCAAGVGHADSVAGAARRRARGVCAGPRRDLRLRALHRHADAIFARLDSIA